MSTKNKKDTKKRSEKFRGSARPLSPEKAARAIELEIYRQMVREDLRELALNRLERGFEKAAKVKTEETPSPRLQETKTFYDMAEKATPGDGLDVDVTIDDDFSERTKTNRFVDFGSDEEDSIQFAKLADE